MKRLHLVIGTLFLPTAISLAIVDTNENGLSDLWEQAHNNGDLFSETYDPQADPDQDGWTNAQEAAAGTDPDNPNPPDGIIAPDLLHTPAVMGTDGNGQPIIITPEVLTVSWPTQIGKQYTLLFSPDLSATSWFQVPTSQFIGDGNIHEFHFDLSGGDKCFWRVSITDVDSDDDSLTDAEEQASGTNPNNQDSDGDGSGDGEEVRNGSNPNSQQSDSDNLADGEDAGPIDPVINWKRTSSPSFAVIPLKSGAGVPNMQFVDVSHDGIVLMLDPKNTTDGSGMFSAFDGSAGEHLIPRNRPGLSSPDGYFGSLAISLVDGKVLGERLVDSISKESIWDLANSFEPYPIDGYHDDFRDAHHGFLVRVKSSVDPNRLIAQNDTVLNGSTPGAARIERHGNISSNDGYWRYNPNNQSYGPKQPFPENAAVFIPQATASATLTQTWPPTPPSTVAETHVWNLVMGETSLLCAQDDGAFTQSGLAWTTNTGLPISVTSQGWVACEKQIWANGQWQSLKEMLGTPVPDTATLLGMIDNGVGVARLEKTGDPSKLVLLLPVELELTHTEKERDEDGNELPTVVSPGKSVLLRDEIADLRIKVPTLNGTDWNMKFDLEPGVIKTDTLGTRGNVQMYDFGTMNGTTITPLSLNANGTTKSGPYDLQLKHANEGQEALRIVVNKEGVFRVRLTSTNNKINALSPEFTVRKRIRKYSKPYPGFPSHDPNQYDQKFEDAASFWADFYNHPIDNVDRIKAISVAESNVGAHVQNKTLRPHDILTIGHPDDDVLETIQGNPEQWDLDLSHPKKPASDARYRKLNYPEANIDSTREAIKWGVLWLYVKAFSHAPADEPNLRTTASNPNFTYEKRNRTPYNVLDGEEEPERNFIGWHSWDDATRFYNGGGDSSNPTKIHHAFIKGQHYYNGTTKSIWPIVTDESGRP